MKRRTPLRRVSVKQAAKLKAYSDLRAAYLTEFPTCDICHTFRSRDVHHVHGRGRYLCSVETWLPVCRPCHEWIHTHAREARELGYLT